MEVVGITLIRNFPLEYVLRSSLSALLYYPLSPIQYEVLLVGPYPNYLLYSTKYC